MKMRVFDKKLPKKRCKQCGTKLFSWGTDICDSCKTKNANMWAKMDQIYRLFGGI